MNESLYVFWRQHVHFRRWFMWTVLSTNWEKTAVRYYCADCDQTSADHSSEHSKHRELMVVIEKEKNWRIWRWAAPITSIGDSLRVSTVQNLVKDSTEDE